MAIDYGINQAEMMLLDKGVSDYSTLGPNTDTFKVYSGIKALRASRVRMGAIWSYIEPTKPTSDAQRKWVDLDRSMQVCAMYGMRPHVTLGLVFPQWGPTVADFGAHCRAVAQRYGSQGMNLNPSYEIMNEVNNTLNLNPCTAAHYVPYLKAAYTNIKEVAPEATVVSAGLVPINDGQFGPLLISVSPLKFVKNMYLAGAQGYFDALGNHPYSTDLNFKMIPPTPDGVFQKMDDDIYQVMVANGDGAKKIWWTEMGFTIPPLSQQQQSDYMAAHWQIYLNKPHVGPAFVYNYRTSGKDTSNGNNNYGIVDYDYNKRLAWSVVNTFNAGVDASLSASGSLTGRVTQPAGLSASGSLTATFRANIKLPGILTASGSLTGALFGRPAALSTATGTLTADSVVAVKRTPTLSASGSLTATADTVRRFFPALTATGTLTATPATQKLYSYVFSGTGTQKPTGLFTDFGSGYSVSGSKANSNNPSPYVDGYYLSGGIYKLDQGSADHFSECPTSVGGYGGFSVNGYYVGATPGLPDRSNCPVVRSTPDGSQFVSAYGHWGGGNSTAIFIVDANVNGGQPIVQITSSFAWTSESDVMRLTADGNTYTLTNTNTGAVALVWVDNTGVYAGATNRRTGFGLQSIVSNGASYRGPGVGRTWKGQDVRPSVVVPPAPIPVAGSLAADGALTAVSVMSYQSTVGLTGSGTLSATLGGGLPALLTASGSLAASVGRPVASSGLSASGSLTGTGIPNYNVTAALSASGSLTAAIGAPSVAHGATGAGSSSTISGSSSTVTASAAHTSGTDDNLVVVTVGIALGTSSTASIGAITCTYGGVAMTPVGDPVTSAPSTFTMAMRKFYIQDPSPGESAIIASAPRTGTASSANSAIFIESDSYGNAGTPTGQTQAAANSATSTVTSGSTATGAFAHFAHITGGTSSANITAYNRTQRKKLGPTGRAVMLTGDAVAADATIASTATQSAALWLALACIIPAG